jgi:hypothetical protein
MTRTPRRRHYVSRPTLALVKPLFRYSLGRDAYVLRGIGGSRGPVLRRERRNRQRDWPGPERRRLIIG